MPELAEVAFHCSVWARSLGSDVLAIEANAKSRCFRDADTNDLDSIVSRSLTSADTHGKQMIFGFENQVWLGVHLGMTGSLIRSKNDYSRNKHDHLMLRTTDAALIFNDPRMFGKITLDICHGYPGWWKNLPISISSKEFNYEYFDRILVRRKRSVLKAFLLYQDAFPGVGNWMADEILWKARIDPRRRVESLTPNESKALFKAVRFVCDGAMKTVGIDYRDPPKGWLFHRRWKAGGHCPKSKKLLERESIGGRTTCWSSAWQS